MNEIAFGVWMFGMLPACIIALEYEKPVKQVTAATLLWPVVLIYIIGDGLKDLMDGKP